MKKALVLLFLVFKITASAQILDTSAEHRYKPIKVFYTNDYQVAELDTNVIPVDTAINNFYNYYSAYKNAYPFIDLGLEGSPLLDLSRANNQVFGFHTGFHNLDYYYFSDTVKIYQTERPFTRFNYSQGEEELIYIEATHAQQVSKRLNIGVDYRRLKNQNFYFSNISNIDRVRMNNLFNARTYFNIFSIDRKYELTFSYLWNSSRNVVSGGVKYDSVFNGQEGRNKIDNNSARFKDAGNWQTQNQFTAIQYFRPESKLKDTARIYELGRFSNQFYLRTKFNSERFEFFDNNPDTLNYGQELDAFSDSIYHRSFSNEFGYSLRSKAINFSVGLTHSYHSIYIDSSAVQRFNNVFALGNTELNIKNWQLNANGKLGLLGYNVGDFDLRGTLTSTFNKIRISAAVQTQLIEPQYTMQNFTSESTSWSKNFKKSNYNLLKAGGLIRSGKNSLLVGINNETHLNYIYFNDLASPQQETSLINLLQLKAKYAFQSKIFSTQFTALYQNSSNDVTLPRPELSATNNTYINFKLFKKKLGLQVGLKTMWFSNFNAPVYNPIIRQWQVTNQKFQSYPLANPYLVAKVKSFNFGLEFFHAQMQLLGNDYYNSPNYPTMPRALRINIRWDMSN